MSKQAGLSQDELQKVKEAIEQYTLEIAVIEENKDLASLADKMPVSELDNIQNIMNQNIEYCAKKIKALNLLKIDILTQLLETETKRNDIKRNVINSILETQNIFPKSNIFEFRLKNDTDTDIQTILRNSAELIPDPVTFFSHQSKGSALKKVLSDFIKMLETEKRVESIVFKYESEKDNNNQITPTKSARNT